MQGGRTDIPVCLTLAKSAIKHLSDQSMTDRNVCLT